MQCNLRYITWFRTNVPGLKFQPFSVPFLGHVDTNDLWKLNGPVGPAMSLWQAEVERKKEKWERNWKMFRQDLQPSWNDVTRQVSREYRCCCVYLCCCTAISSSRMCDQNVERESRSQHFICQLTLSLIEWLHILLHIKTPRTNCTKLKTIRKSILFVNSVLIFYITEYSCSPY